MSLIKNVCLEVSLKPFKSTKPAYIESVCRTIFTQWRDMVEKAEQISVLMWTADGSELLDYTGDLTAAFEWDRFIGGANPRQGWNNKDDPNGRGLHTRNYDYMENPPVMHYSDLQMIIKTIKRVGLEMTGKEIRVGETFDPGPEFAISDFKYNRHNEVCEGQSMGNKSMVCCYYTLNADEYPYVAYPNGVPQGTPFGEFLGKQSQHFLSDMGFDYIWLSNGFGFGTETWGVTGALYDGSKFYPEKVKDCESKIAEFWSLFCANCTYPIETRGTNLTVGIDYSSDAVNHKMIYENVPKLLPPPNSPWAALDGNFGLELAGYMSRAAELPEEDYLFRFYIHDPWWLNSPWIDRYEGQPHDIYLPMSCARINAKGETVVANHLNLLSIDNSYGEMPDRVPREVTPYLLGAYENAPDAPSPLVWVYPFEEYSTMSSGRLEKSFFEDWYFIAALNRGLPVSTVVSNGNFVRFETEKPDLLQHSVLVLPVPEQGSPVVAALASFVARGGKAMLYGSTRGADAAVLELLNLKQAEELSGDFTVSLAASYDADLRFGAYGETAQYGGILTDGGLLETLADACACTTVLATAEQGGNKRVLAHTVRKAAWQGGAISWCRGSDCSRKATDANDSVKKDTTVKSELFPCEVLMRAQLADMGYTIGVHKLNKTVKEPVVMLHRHGGSVWFSGYCPDTTVSLTFKTPLGAPLLLANETYLENGLAHYCLPRAWRHECRVFANQTAVCGLHCIEDIPTQMGIARRMRVDGLQNATLYILPKDGNPGNTKLLLNSNYPHFVGDPIQLTVVDTVYGKALRAEHVTGTLRIMDITDDYDTYNG